MLLFLSTTLEKKEKLMIELYFSRSSTITRLRCGPLGPDLEALATTLHQQGYTWESIRGYLRGCAQFGQWLSQQGYAVADVNPTLVRHYISGLQRPPSGRLPEGAQGLSHLRMARRFLTACFHTGHVNWPSLRAQQITDFVRQEAAGKHGGGRKLPSTAVRSLLRFLVFRGELPPGLEAAALAPRQWVHDSLPKHLTAEEVERVLALYASESPTDRRNRAILMLLARLGLRAPEVVRLCLEDIDWHEGRIVIRSRKTHHDRVLPLSQDVGRALADYLCWGRPATTSRIVFLHGLAPFRPFADAAAISRIAARSLHRVGVTGYARLGAP